MLDGQIMNQSWTSTQIYRAYSVPSMIVWNIEELGLNIWRQLCMKVFILNRMAFIFDSEVLSLVLSLVLESIRR